MVGVRVYTGDCTPIASPAITLTSTPSFSAVGMFSLGSSWYLGSILNQNQTVQNGSKLGN